MDGEFPHDGVNGNRRQKASRRTTTPHRMRLGLVKVGVTGDALALDQTAMSGFDSPSVQTSKQEVLDSPPMMTWGMEGGSGGGSDKEMTYAPLMSVPLPGHGRDHSYVPITAAACGGDGRGSFSCCPSGRDAGLSEFRDAAEGAQHARR